MSSLKYFGLIKAYFPLHNEYDLEGFDRVRHPTDLDDKEGQDIEEKIKEN